MPGTNRVEMDVNTDKIPAEELKRRRKQVLEGEDE